MIEIDLKIQHHFSDGLYAKEMQLPKDHYAVSHKHIYDHLSILSKGKVIIEIDNVKKEYIAPACINIVAGVEHKIIAIEDSFWYCIHATSETDIAMVDNVLIERSI
jgi:quercetin dioxygenase-like cupin family protein